MLVGVQTVPAAPARESRRTEDEHEGRYVRRVLETARTLQSDTQFVVFTHAANHEAYAGWPRRLVDLDRDASSRWPRRRSALARALGEADLDLLLSPLHSASEDVCVPQVVYALDSNAWETEPGAPRQGAQARLGSAKRVCAGARSIIVPSEQLRRRCLELFEAPLNKIIVAPPGVDSVFHTPQFRPVEPPYLLVFSDALSSARVPEIEDTFDRRGSEFPHALVIAGPGAGEEPAQRGERVVCIERCPDALLAALYQHCALFVYPAIHDGGALRVLEALSAGAITVAPRSGAIEELAGNVPFYYNPRSMDSLLQTVRHVLALSPEEREHRVRFGQSASVRFTWDKTAWKFLSAFRHG